MATVERTVELIFAGVDQTSGPVKGIVSALTGLEDGIAAVAKPLAQAADFVLKMDAALAAMAVGGMVVAIREAGNFSDSFNEISTLITATDEELALFERSILDYARSSTASLADINNAVYQAISLGVDFKSSIEAVTVAEKLAVAGKADLGATVELLIGTMNAYGAGMEEAERFSDAFFTTVKLGKTTIPELASSLAMVTSTAVAAGIPIETVMAAISALTAAGMPTSLAITSLNAAINGIIKPTETARKEFGDLGIEVGSAGIQSLGFEGILRAVQAATGGNADAMAKLFPAIEGFKGAVILARDASGLFAVALEGMDQKAGSTQSAYEKMAANFALINRNLVTNIQATLVQAGLPLLEQYGDTVRALAAVFESIGTGIDAGALAPLVDMVVAAGDAIEEFLRRVAEALPTAMGLVDFSPLTDALAHFSDTVLGYFDKIDLSTPEGLAKAIQFAVDSIALLVNVTTGISREFEPVVKQILSLIDKFNQLPPSIQDQLIGRLLGYGKVIDEFGVKTALLSKYFDTMGGQNINQRMLDDTDKYAHLLHGVGEAATKVGPALDVAAAGATKFASASASGTDYISGLAAATAKAGVDTELAAKAVELFGKDLGEAVAKLPGFEQLLTNTGTAADKVGQGLDEAGTKTAKWTAETLGATTQVGELYQGLDGVWRQLPGYSTGLSQATAETQTLGEATKTLAADSEDFRLKMAQLQADFALGGMKLNIDLQVAKLESETKQIQAAFDSIGTTIVSTGDTIAALFGMLAAGLGPGASPFLAGTIQQAIQQQQTMQWQAHQLQMDLVNAQIAAIQARTAALQSGQALIQIDGTGLSPSLQMVMWDIIEEVQLRVNQNAADFLLGVP